MLACCEGGRHQERLHYQSQGSQGVRWRLVCKSCLTSWAGDKWRTRSTTICSTQMDEVHQEQGHIRSNWTYTTRVRGSNCKPSQWNKCSMWQVWMVCGMQSYCKPLLQAYTSPCLLVRVQAEAHPSVRGGFSYIWTSTTFNHWPSRPVGVNGRTLPTRCSARVQQALLASPEQRPWPKAWKRIWCSQSSAWSGLDPLLSWKSRFYLHQPKWICICNQGLSVWCPA